jgi:hypothetical protein
MLLHYVTTTVPVNAAGVSVIQAGQEGSVSAITPIVQLTTLIGHAAVTVIVTAATVIVILPGTVLPVSVAILIVHGQ